MRALRTRARVAAAVLLAGLAAPAGASSFPVFDNDPVDSSSARPYPILPGTPLILPQPNGKFNPPIVDSSTVGDVDLVVRAGTIMVGPSIPPPSASPTTAVAGGAAMAGGSGIPFTVVVSDGNGTPASGNPLLGPEMDGIPVLVAAFADLDGDGVVGPTNADDGGADDDARELQESDYLVGRQIAIFHNGVAQGTLFVWKGAPASAGGLHVVLTALAYVGPFSPSFFFGSVPDGPPVATLLPFFPRYDPDHVVEANGRGGLAEPGHRLGIELEPAFEPPVDDPDLGTPFALATDGSSPTIDRVAVYGGPLSRLRFVRPSSATGFPVGAEVPLHRGAGGALYEDLSSVDVPDNGPGSAVPVRLVPVDALDNVTDPPAGARATLIAGPGLVISAPDTDGDPTRETVPVAGADGVDVTLDDAGGMGDSGTGSTVTVALDGVPVETLAVRFVPGAAAAERPTITHAELAGHPDSAVAGHPLHDTVVAVVDDPQADAASVTGAITLNGSPLGTLLLQEGPPPPGLDLPPGQVFTGPIDVTPSETGVLEISLTARDVADHVSDPDRLSLPVFADGSAAVSELSISPDTAPAGRLIVTITARIAGVDRRTRITAQMDRGKGFHPIARLNDKGLLGDAVAGDGVFSKRRTIRMPVPGSFPVRVMVTDRVHGSVASAPVELHVVAP